MLNAAKAAANVFLMTRNDEEAEENREIAER